MGFKTRLGGHKINETFQKFFFSYLCVASVSLSRSFFILLHTTRVSGAFRVRGLASSK